MHRTVTNPLPFHTGCRDNTVSALLEIGNVSTFQDFDGHGKAYRFGDNMLSASVGIFLTIGKTGWKRAIDATPYIRQNGWLRGYVSRLAESNRRYAGQHDRNTQTLNELKKILEIEGLLEKYSRLFDDRENLGHGYLKNDYSGLNSLRTRLKNRRWDGKSPLTGDSLTGSSAVAGDVAGVNGGCMDNADGMNAGSLKSANRDGDTIPSCSHPDYLALISSGKGCIGSPVFFFFELGTTRLTDRSQMVNLDELARVAKKYGLSVTVAGVADAATGTADANSALSVSRADYITAELERRGLSAERITRVGKGGISDYSPAETNRHTKVMLHIKR